MIPLDPVVRLAIDRTIRRLRIKQFQRDPAIPDRQSRTASIVGSAQKRHGHIIELALRCALQRNADLVVWCEPRFYIHATADHVYEAAPDDTIRQSALPYLPNEGRHIGLDIVALRPSHQFLSSYEVKRATAPHDAGKTRQIKRDLICTQLQLRNYGEHRGHRVQSVEAHLIAYYGRSHIKPPWSISRDNLNEHFGCEVVSEVERATEYFAEQIARICDDPAGVQMTLFPSDALL